MGNRTALLAALGVDNFGSGLFLPLALVYVTRDVGLSVGTAGGMVAAGTLAGLAIPAVAGRLVDRTGPLPVVIVAQLIQALGAAAYLAARDAGAVLAAAAALAAGQQLFYSSLFALISDVAGDIPRDRPFAVANMVRAASFGLGGLAAAALITSAGPAGDRLAVAADSASFVVCAVLLAVLVRLPREQYRAARVKARRSPAAPGLLSDRPFLALIAVTGLIALTVDFFLTGMPVYVLERLHGPPWLPGTTLALATALSSLGGTLALRITGHLSRVTAMQRGGALYVGFSAVSLAAVIMPPGWRPLDLLAAALVMTAGGLLSGARAVALAEAAAPPGARGRYLAAYQYAFTVPGVIAPGLVALYSVAIWLPWLLVGACAALAILALRALSAHLPAAALHPEPEPARQRESASTPTA
jgi:MFS family permease